jgi:hypothetical protein
MLGLLLAQSIVLSSVNASSTIMSWNANNNKDGTPFTGSEKHRPWRLVLSDIVTSDSNRKTPLDNVSLTLRSSSIRRWISFLKQFGKRWVDSYMLIILLVWKALSCRIFFRNVCRCRLSLCCVFNKLLSSPYVSACPYYLFIIITSLHLCCFSLFVPLLYLSVSIFLRINQELKQSYWTLCKSILL